MMHVDDDSTYPRGDARQRGTIGDQDIAIIDTMKWALDHAWRLLVSSGDDLEFAVVEQKYACQPE